MSEGTAEALAWLDRVTAQTRAELGLDGAQGGGPMALNGFARALGGLGDAAMTVVPGAGGVPHPAQNPYAYNPGIQQGYYRPMPTTVGLPYVARPAEQVLLPGMAPAQVGNPYYGIRGLGAVKELTAEQKNGLTRLVNDALAEAKQAEGRPPTQLDFLSQRINAGRTMLMGTTRWSTGSWGILGPSYESWSSLMDKVNRAQNLVLKAKGRVAPGVITSTGAVRQDSPAAAAAAGDALASWGKWLPWLAVGGVAVYAVASGAAGNLFISRRSNPWKIGPFKVGKKLTPAQRKKRRKLRQKAKRKQK